jgi:hypothetical protein
VDFASCVGSLIYLGVTQIDISYAINKLAKYTRQPGRKHFEALIHLLRYFCDNSHLGLKYYNNTTEAHLTRMLMEQNISTSHLFYGFSDSSWNDDQDTGCSTGCFIIVYMGGIIDHSSNLPDPVALSSAEAENNEGCIAMMAASHLCMLLCEMEGIDESSLVSTPIYFDSKSAMAMGNSYKDTKRTHHIMRRYHYVRENIGAKHFSMEWISTQFQIADIGTKQTPGPRHQFLVEMIQVKVKDEAKKSASVQEG